METQFLSVRSLFSRSRRFWFICGLLVIFVGLSVQYTFKVLGGNGSAVVRWQQALQELLAGKDIYDQYVHPNSPTMAVLLMPLAHLPPLPAALLWFYLKVGMALTAICWAFRLVETPERPFPDWAKAIVIVLSLRPIMGDLMHGNVNLLILFLVVGALYAFHQRWDQLAGVVLALAIACKVTPVLFVPYFLWKRAWKTLAACTIALPLFLWFLPGAVLGMNNATVKLQSWAKQMIVPFVVEGRIFYSEHNNQSLPGLVARLTTHSPSFSDYDEKNQYQPTDYHNILDLNPSAAKWITKGCMAAFALLIVLRCRTQLRRRQGWQWAAEFSLIVLGMLLFSERTWKHHCVTLLLPFTVLVYYLAACRPTFAVRCYLIGTLAAVVLMMSSTSTGLLPDRFAKLAQVYGAYVWAYLLLIAALLVMLRQSNAAVEAVGEAEPAQALEQPSAVLAETTG